MDKLALDALSSIPGAGSILVKYWEQVGDDDGVHAREEILKALERMELKNEEMELRMKHMNSDEQYKMEKLLIENDKILHKLGNIKQNNNYKIDMSNLRIDGNGNVVNIASPNTVITNINQKFNGTDKEELGKSLGLLKATILELPIPEKIKSRTDRIVSNIEDEVLDAEPNLESIVEDLKSIKQVIKDNNQNFENDKGWGQKFVQVISVAKDVLPGIIPLVTSLL